MMDESSARAILGLKARENPRPRLAEFRANVRRREAFIENAPSPETKLRLKKELHDYEQAIEVIAAVAQSVKQRRHVGFCCCLLVIATAAACGWWKYDQYVKQQIELEQARELDYEHRRFEQKEKLVNQRLKEGEGYLNRRQWKSATEAYQSALSIDPGSVAAEQGLEAVSAGKLEEKNQKIFYRLGESQAAMEAGEWEKAIRLTQSVLKENPGHPEATKKLKSIKLKQHQQKVSLLAQAVERDLESGDLQQVQQSYAQLEKEAPDHPGLQAYSKRMNQALAELQARQRQALALMQQAKELDKGEYSSEAVRLLDQAAQLDPDNPEVKKLHQKINNYSRTVKVPEDVATITEAIAMARARDRVEIAPGIYHESIILDKPIKLEGGAGVGKLENKEPNTRASEKPRERVILQLPAGEAPLLTVRATADGSHISGISFQHAGFDYDDERASAVIVQGASVTISECSIRQAAGHGLAVIDGAKVRALGCSFTHCGWDGVSVYGKSDKRNSYAELFNCISQDNIQHGMEFWNGGHGKVENCRVLANGLCGILAMSPLAQLTVQTSVCSRNRSAGILVSDQVKGKLVANRCDNNLLSGIVARGQGTDVQLINNVSNGNQEVGILIHQGVKRSAFSGNQATGNKHRQIWLNASAGR
ncbi:right-handed parallel beta-helix repeat-containing protein [Verrucomicrobiaceae bacterium N1E253]|uniref:Right-handed parallel beta-helix repeat-containing protein n=1 Tax=Oceaniferula marina TaxID=2748318 RepID=A0A851GET8_9BACT|nr:right-handed parallel beta-helix repeat-containing protein [Oceaniferula marina]NWK54241.1 right-handed parallel beta-helix repeat-containing protein [Oceaniferula marina]